MFYRYLAERLQGTFCTQMASNWYVDHINSLTKDSGTCSMKHYVLCGQVRDLWYKFESLLSHPVQVMLLIKESTAWIKSKELYQECIILTVESNLDSFLQVRAIFTRALSRCSRVVNETSQCSLVSVKRPAHCRGLAMTEVPVLLQVNYFAQQSGSKCQICFTGPHWSATSFRRFPLSLRTVGNLGYDQPTCKF